MKKIISIGTLLVAFVLLSSTNAFAQLHAPDRQFPQEYIKVTNQRAEKIVDNMNINDPTKKERVKDLIAQQYRDLSAIQDKRDATIKSIKQKNDGKRAKKRVKKIKKKAKNKIDRLHKEYVQNLNSELTFDQVAEVKDGMTYHTLEFTYRGYTDLLPELTKEQKKQIKRYLIEAREHAIDAGSSDKKHAWFNDAKGKINNYLSQQGYDLNKAEKRRRERNDNDSD